MKKSNKILKATNDFKKISKIIRKNILPNNSPAVFAERTLSKFFLQTVGIVSYLELLVFTTLTKSKMIENKEKIS